MVGVYPKTKIGTLKPALLNSMASVSTATANLSAPLSKKVWAISIEPWPYPLAFTTAVTKASLRVSLLTSLMLWAKLSRLISAHTGLVSSKVYI